jgi:hypothetical protein
MDRPTPHCFVPLGDHHRVIYGTDISQTPVADVYQAAHELISLNRTNQLLKTTDLADLSRSLS